MREQVFEFSFFSFLSPLLPKKKKNCNEIFNIIVNNSLCSIDFKNRQAGSYLWYYFPRCQISCDHLEGTL